MLHGRLSDAGAGKVPPSRRSAMESGSAYGDATPRVVRRVTTRRSLLKGLTALMAVGAVAPLAAACAPQQPAAKPAETKPAEPAKPAAPAAPAEAAKPAAPAAAQPTVAAKPAAAGGEPKKGGTLKWATIGEPPAL